MERTVSVVSATYSISKSFKHRRYSQPRVAISAAPHHIHLHGEDALFTKKNDPTTFLNPKTQRFAREPFTPTLLASGNCLIHNQCPSPKNAEQAQTDFTRRVATSGPQWSHQRRNDFSELSNYHSPYSVRDHFRVGCLCARLKAGLDSWRCRLQTSPSLTSSPLPARLLFGKKAVPSCSAPSIVKVQHKCVSKIKAASYPSCLREGGVPPSAMGRHPCAKRNPSLFQFRLRKQ